MLPQYGVTGAIYSKIFLKKLGELRDKSKMGQKFAKILQLVKMILNEEGRERFGCFQVTSKQKREFA